MFWQQNSKPLKNLQKKEGHTSSVQPGRLPQQSPFFKFISSFFLFCVLFGTILIADYFLPRKTLQETVVSWDAEFDGHHYPKKYFFLKKLHNEIPIEFSIRTEHTKTPLSIDDAMIVDEGDSIYIYRTLLFQITTHLKTADQITIQPYFNFYSSLVFIPVLLILISLIGIFKKVKEDWLYTFVVVNILLLASFIVIRLFYF